MHKNKKFLAIIPARGGSKRLPKKNILNLAGKPMIAWTIEAALGSKYIDRVVVSTDSKDIAKISRDYGADVPFKRPNEFATDSASSVDVVINTLNSLNRTGEEYDYIILLQPTSPLRTTYDIDKAIMLLQAGKINAVISASKVECSHLWFNTPFDNEILSNSIGGSFICNQNKGSGKCYMLNGAIYICSTRNFLMEKTFFLKKGVSIYEMKKERSIDIDESHDFKISELYLLSKISK